MSRQDHRPGRRVTSHVGQTIVAAASEDISGGVIAQLDNFVQYTVYVESEGAIEIEILFSPDEGEHFVGLAEGPIIFTDASRTILEMNINATHIQFIGDTSALVSIWIRGIY